MGKKKGNKKKQAEDDDWEALLEAEAAANKEAAPSPAAEEPKEPEPEKPAEPEKKLDAAAAFLAAQGLVDDAPATAKKDNKKKKARNKKKGGATAEKADDSKVSAKGKLVAERLRLQREEEERVRALEEAEAKRIAEIEAAEEAERKRVEEEKERKKQKQREKIEQQKRDGTYMTKAQKAKAKQAALRLEAMKAAGMVPGEKTKDDGPTSKPSYKEKKISKKKQEEMQKAAEEEARKKAEEEERKRKEQEEQDAIADDWDADSWDASDSDDDKFADLDAKLKEVTMNETEDLIGEEQRKEQERLKQLGIEREKREKIEAEKRAAFMAEEEEAKLKELQAAQLREEGKRRREATEKANLEARSRDDLRCPIVVIMGHVDTGKTKLLDKIRHTNVQEGEAGGITQQIGATYFEKKTLEQQTARLNKTEKFEFTVPGMLVIDTPGHESFTNLRSRGSSLCDVAILVVDLMHGLEQQTIESLNMLKSRGTPFVVALNKIDRCYAWNTCPDAPIREALTKQQDGTIGEFRSRADSAKLQLQEQGINSNIYWEMGEDDWENSDFVPLVPTSAISGEGVQDILMLLCQMAQRKLWKQLMWCANLQCTVLEVKAIDGLGMTVDVLVVNGYLKEGDRVAMCTLDGPVITEIRGLLTPPPSREMRIKSEYIHHKQIKGALGVKVIGNGLEKVMAGTPVMVVGPDDEEEDIKAEVMSDLTKLQDKLSTDKKGVMVQASTLGALEALLQFLREETNPPIPVSAIGIGTIHKRDVTKISIMNEKGFPEFATILAFDVDINKEATEHAAEVGVRIFTAEIIYHLFDQFTRYMEELTEKRRADAAAVAVFPSIVKILPQHIFNTKDPIIVGMEVVEGILKVGTPLCVPALDHLHVGKVTSIESNGKEQDTARKGQSVAVKIVNENNPTITYGRQFDASNSLYSTLTRASIDALKTNFKDKLENEDWRLVIKLKKIFGIL
mmetsp:Transcript_21307/g.31818  ORF Transcript_21307/g.31818 Transcript_21307/m.31818 type:complete len:964 (-) Transcript_21307:105-2996(-)|eukprot:CAMPEP_0116020024 /NCGR_PEP_ID=MMETSP0321-20121206/9564_1 /TAXON_ID=163516 /ORGANISM="Leptocylindrus danicus var. danicus, Strain B650" /LENGTH=963 /DNA_ID=CAMNT_0003490663 /DNA_START=93 /DNA_END=2984 /DNA_ORIENTATION=-